MTGYGAGAAEAPGARVTVEIRGVNQRVLDAKVAVPREYASWETEIREGVRKTAQRGRVEVTVLRTPIPGKRRYRVTVQPALARAYVGAARKLVRTLRLAGSPSLGDVLRLPGLFEVSEAPPDLGRQRARRGPDRARGGDAGRARRHHRGAGPPREPPGRARDGARRARAGRQADRLPRPGGPPRAQHDGREGGGPRDHGPRARGEGRAREAPGAGAERGVNRARATEPRARVPREV